MTEKCNQFMACNLETDIFECQIHIEKHYCKTMIQQNLGMHAFLIEERI